MNLHDFQAPLWTCEWPEIREEFASLERALLRAKASAPPESLEAIVLGETYSDLQQHLALPDQTRGVVVLERKTGFFSLVLIVVSHLAIAQKRGLSVRAHFGRDCLYADPTLSDPQANMWDLFFEPLAFDPGSAVSSAHAALPSRAELEAACDQDRFLPGNIRVTRRNPALVMSPGRIDEANRRFFGELLARHVRPRPHVHSAVETFIAANFTGHRVIGVHARGNEHDGELGFFRLSRVSLEAYFQAVDAEMARLGADRIYLATDQRDLAEAFRARYGTRLLAFDAQRCEPGQSVHLTTGGARVGFEVLCECLLLSRCDHLVHGISNVPAAACYFNPDLPHTNVYLRHRLRSRYGYESLQFRERTLHRLRYLKLRADQLMRRSP